jgi:DNA-binding HxlR family transcriptional regulator
VADKVYGQYCGLAKALDLVGERWTLLIIRELSFAPRRFSDLVEGLRGISTAVLTERLNRLEDARLIFRRTLPPPAASKVYALTEDGQELARALVPLAAWGVRILAANRRKRTEAFRPAWGFLFLRETLDASSARDVHDVYEIHIDDSVISVIADDGEMQVIEGRAAALSTSRSMSTRPRTSTWEWGAFAVAMRYAKGSCDSWAAKRLFAATRASFARWLRRDRVAHVSIVTAGRSVTVHGAGHQMAPQIVGRDLFRSAHAELRLPPTRASHVPRLLHVTRPHQSLGNDSSRRRAVRPVSSGHIVTVPEVGGLHHRYQRAA